MDPVSKGIGLSLDDIEESIARLAKAVDSEAHVSVAALFDSAARLASASAAIRSALAKRNRMQCFAARAHRSAP